MPKKHDSPSTVVARLPAFIGMLDSPEVRHIKLDIGLLYSVLDVLALLERNVAPRDYWRGMVRAQPDLSKYIVNVSFEFPGDREAAKEPGTDLAGMLRIAQSLAHPAAERVRRWLAEVGAARTEEAANPELAIFRTREEFRRRGYPPEWIDRRMRAMAARAQIVGEWHRRGAEESADYRELTNALFSSAFQLDVEAYRKAKGLTDRDNLRDHMSEVELALVTLGETVGGELHRLQSSRSVEELLRDMRDAGAIIAEARKRIEEASGQGVVDPNPRPWVKDRAEERSEGNIVR